MDLERVLAGFVTECEAMDRGLEQVTASDWERPTRCAPWSVKGLLGHVCVVLGWLPGMLDAEAPERAEVSAAEYYRPDHRFDAATNATRIDLGRQRFDGLPVEALTAQFAQVWREVEDRCRHEPADRVVHTRHGDAMLLSDFLVTRVVEVAVHGLDLADALAVEPWLTPAAAKVVLGDRLDELGWGHARLLRRATGRESLTADESEQLNRLGMQWLTLG